jgi:glycosyltransferase involved in cell wall biosynthesis
MAKAGLVGGLAAYLAGVPVRIYHNHGLAMLSSHGLRRQLLRATDWLTNRFATHALFCSESTRDEGIAAGVVVPEKSGVLGQGTISGVNVSRFKPDATGKRRARQRNAWGVDEGTVVVGFVGRLVPHKGIETLIDAWRQLGPAVHRRACLVLAGGTVYSEPRMREIVEHAVNDGIGIMTVGWVEDMVACYGGMDLLVLPSWHEGFPYSILEAQCMGLPVITTRATGNLDAVVHEVTGISVPLKDAVALATAMTRLIDSAEDRQRLGEQGRRRILEEFTQEKVLGHMLDFYKTEVGRLWERKR